MQNVVIQDNMTGRVLIVMCSVCSTTLYRQQTNVWIVLFNVWQRSNLFIILLRSVLPVGVSEHFVLTLVHSV